MASSRQESPELWPRIKLEDQVVMNPNIFYFNKSTYEVRTRLKSKVSQSSGEKSLLNNEFALWLLQSCETHFTDSCTRCAKLNSENINDHAYGIKENSKDGDVHHRSVASFFSGSTARPQSTNVA